MPRLCRLLLIVTCALFVPATTPFAESAPAMEVETAALEAEAPAAEAPAEPCPEPAEISFVEPPAFASGDFVLCSCHYCRAHPQDECRISPTGFSIICKDYYKLNCT